MSEPELEALTTAMHDSMCLCGGRCFGWDTDYNVIHDFFRDRYGSVVPLISYLEILRDE